MTKKFRIISYNCLICGLTVKILIKTDGSLIFSTLDKLHSSEQCLTNNGYYICIECKSTSTLRFEYIFS